MFPMNGEREAVVWNCSCVNVLKETVLHRTVPRHRVNGKPIRTIAERFHTEPSKVPCKHSLNIEVVTTPETQRIIFKYLLMYCFITKQNKSGAE